MLWKWPPQEFLFGFLLRKCWHDFEIRLSSTASFQVRSLSESSFHHTSIRVIVHILVYPCNNVKNNTVWSFPVYSAVYIYVAHRKSYCVDVKRHGERNLHCAERLLSKTPLGWRFEAVIYSCTSYSPKTFRTTYLFGYFDIYRVVGSSSSSKVLLVNGIYMVDMSCNIYAKNERQFRFCGILLVVYWHSKWYWYMSNI